VVAGLGSALVPYGLATESVVFVPGPWAVGGAARAGSGVEERALFAGVEWQPPPWLVPRVCAPSMDWRPARPDVSWGGRGVAVGIPVARGGLRRPAQMRWARACRPCPDPAPQRPDPMPRPCGAFEIHARAVDEGFLSGVPFSVESGGVQLRCSVCDLEGRGSVSWLRADEVRRLAPARASGVAHPAQVYGLGPVVGV